MVCKRIHNKIEGEGILTEFWNELLTQASWEKLLTLSKEFSFILIGGWAIYLWTGKHKSKDIDIIVDYKILSKLQEEYQLIKNDRLKKYEIKLDKFDIDIYLPYYSKLAIPVADLEEFSVRVQGITTITPESLLILKQGAELERRDSVKGQKDMIDILMILLYGSPDLRLYNKLIVKYNLTNYLTELINVINNFNLKDVDYLDMNLKKFTDWKKDIITRLKELK